jgi:hypothetical protein
MSEKIKELKKILGVLFVVDEMTEPLYQTCKEILKNDIKYFVQQLTDGKIPYDSFCETLGRLIDNYSETLKTNYKSSINLIAKRIEEIFEGE